MEEPAAVRDGPEPVPRRGRGRPGECPGAASRPGGAEFAFWKSPGGRGLPGLLGSARVFLAFDEAIQGPWRGPRTRSRLKRLRVSTHGWSSSCSPTPSRATCSRSGAKMVTRLPPGGRTLYPTSPILGSPNSRASAEIGMHGDAVTEAEMALRLDGLTPHLDKKLPEALARELKAKLPEWANLRDNPPKPPAKPRGAHRSIGPIRWGRPGSWKPAGPGLTAVRGAPRPASWRRGGGESVASALRSLSRVKTSAAHGTSPARDTTRRPGRASRRGRSARPGGATRAWPAPWRSRPARRRGPGRRSR